jgi:hypothetical protein
MLKVHIMTIVPGKNFNPLPRRDVTMDRWGVDGGDFFLGWNFYMDILGGARRGKV